MDLRQNTTLQVSKLFHFIPFSNYKDALCSIDLQRVITVLLALTSFSLTVSISLRSLFITLASIAIFTYFFVYQRHEIFQILTTSWFLAALLLFLTILIGCFMSPADRHTQFDFIHKYSKLLYLPLLTLGFQNKQSRFWAIHAFLLGMFITLVCSELKVLGLVSMKGVQADFGEVFYNHIVTGYFMAFAAFLSAIYAIRSHGKVRLLYTTITLLLSYHTLFINQSRTGYVMLAVLTLTFLLGFMRYLLGWLLISIPILCLLLYQTPPIRHWIGNTIDNVKNYQQGPQDHSLGQRLQYHKFAQTLFLRSPLVGLGTGAFSHYFSLEKPVPAWWRPAGGYAMMEPQGEYWLIMVERGFIGLIIFFSFILTLFYEMSLTHDMRMMFLGLLITFLAGCLSDGFLLLSGPGYLLIIFAAMGLGESFIEKQARFAKQYILNKEY